MSELSSEQLTTEKRDQTGTSATRRLRKAGKVPAVLYGHGGEAVSLAVPADQVASVIRHGSKLLELGGTVSEKAFLKEVQWDPLGASVLHLDLARVVAGEKVEVTVTVELRGVAPGISEGGIVDHQVHEVSLECPVTHIPNTLEVNVNSLQLGDSITATELELPEDSTLLLSEDTIIVQCREPAEEDESEDDAVGGPSEPEIVGRKAEDDEAAEE